MRGENRPLEGINKDENGEICSRVCVRLSLAYILVIYLSFS